MAADPTAQMLAQMAETADLLSGETDLASILRLLAERALMLVNADYAAISTFDEAGKLTRFIYAGMDEQDARRLGHPPVGKGLLGDLATQRDVIRLEDLTTHPASCGWPEGHPDMAAFLGVPMRSAGRNFGSFYLTRSRGAPPFTDADELVARLLSLQASISVAGALARERTGRLSLLEERGRIAHDLHDGTIQSLYGLGLQLSALAEPEGFPETARTAVQGAVQHINQLIADIRQYIAMLEAQTPLSSPELARDLAYVVRQGVPPGIDTVLNVTAAALQELDERASEDLLYISREALSNAVRHGTPTRVAVDLRQSGDSTSLTIQDNGIGFDPEHVRSGLGSVTMRTRAERLGAKLSIVGIPGMGTTVRVEIPRNAHD